VLASSHHGANYRSSPAIWVYSNNLFLRWPAFPLITNFLFARENEAAGAADAAAWVMSAVLDLQLR
jgi:hypothetical protein